MARPTRCRRICLEPAYDKFRPEGIPINEKVNMTVDEYEVIRLIDLNKCTHEQCAQQMGISRTTVTEIYESARYKLADSVVNGKILSISGGNYRFCDGTDRFCCNRNCKRNGSSTSGRNIQRKGERQMRIGVTYENGEIRQTQVVDTNGQGHGHGALSSFLTNAGVEVLICGGIGGSAQTALAAAGIWLFGGVSGNADEAVKNYIAGNLNYNPEVHCTHHEHEHTCGEHHCGEDKHGCTGYGNDYEIYE